MAQVHKPAERRRRDLIDAAIAVMEQKGMGEATSRDVTKAAGVSAGLVHHYFDTFDDLLATAFEEVAHADLDRVREALADIPDPVRRLDVLIEVFAPTGDDWQYQVWLDVWSVAARHPTLLQAAQRANTEWQQLMADLFRDGIASGDFHCADPEAAAWRVLALLDGMAIQTVAQQTTMSRSLLHGWVRDAAHAEAGLTR
ncbi:MAG: TetR/AcrR family transcriptional regulator [Nocardioidaceae bacterium]